MVERHFNLKGVTPQFYPRFLSGRWSGISI